MLVHEHRQHVETGLVGHDDVHQDHVRLQLPGLEDRVAPASCLTDRLDVLLLAQEQAETRADDRVVVDDQHTDPLRHTGDVIAPACRSRRDTWKPASGLRLRNDA